MPTWQSLAVSCLYCLCTLHSFFVQPPFNSKLLYLSHACISDIDRGIALALSPFNTHKFLKFSLWHCHGAATIYSCIISEGIYVMHPVYNLYSSRYSFFSLTSTTYSFECNAEWLNDFIYIERRL